jgi:hypothetical protein
MEPHLLTALLTTLVLGVPGTVPAATRAPDRAPPAVLAVGQIAAQNVPPQPGSEPDTLVEPDVAVSPRNRDIAVSVSHDGRYPDGGAVAIAYAWTHDGGQSWHDGALPGLTTTTGGRYARASDPVAAFGPDGTAYVSTLLIDIPGCASAVAVSRSTDGGRTFGGPVLVHTSESCTVYSDDKNWLVADTSPASPYRGRLYQFWTPFTLDEQGNTITAPQVLRWSDDRGETWSDTVTVSDAVVDSQNSQPAIQPDGTITDTYLVYPPGTGGEGPAFAPERALPGTHRRVAPRTAGQAGDRMVARTSTDGGQTWSPEVTVTTDIGSGPEGIRCCLPSVTADPRTGLIHAAWTSVQLRLARLSTSTDGQSWSAPVTVDRGARPGTEVVNVDVTAYGGSVFVSYGTRDTAVAGGRYVQQRVAWSRDDGGRFASSLAVGPRSDLRYAAVARGIFPGDYIGTAAARGRVYAVWCRSSHPPTPGATYHQTLYAAVLRP